MSNDREKALDVALAAIDKQFGKGSIMRMGEKTSMGIEAIQTGALSLDLALGVGGLPRGRVVEIFGPESSGKSTLAMHVVAEAQRNGGICAYTCRPQRRPHPPGGYVRQHVELAYATTVYGAQGETVDTAHFLLGEATGAAAAYVAMTRGRTHNVAHLVADSTDQARRQWVDAFDRDRADLGPAHAATSARDAIDRYGPQAPNRRAQERAVQQAAALRRTAPSPPRASRPWPSVTGPSEADRGGIGR